ncbi:phosphotriesterase-related protein [Streptomyces sp. NPDC047042]|uniref:phosphotriesterase family protein n=1 Tax=Streptomyces sp. NPDC047042 TaxID=3154807 RepID=UPI0033EC3D7E
MTSIQSVAGPIETGELGFVLMHEHILMRDHNVVVNYPHLFDRRKELDEAVQKLRDLKEQGVNTIVDLTTVDTGRDIRFIEDATRESGMQVIAATGMWWQPPAFFATRSVDVLLDCFLTDIREGIAGTSVKAGIIKVATHTEGVTPPIEMALRAGSRAHRQTGIPISTHTDAHAYMGDEQQRIFLEEGVDLSRTVIGHSGDSTDLDYLKRLMDRGSYIGMDRFGLDGVGEERFATTQERVDTIAQLCKEGYAEKMVLSHDASCCWEMLPGDHPVLEGNPNWHLSHILDDVLPMLRQAGVTEEHINEMGVGNPRRIFEQTGGY